MYMYILCMHPLCICEPYRNLNSYYMYTYVHTTGVSHQGGNPVLALPAQEVDKNTLMKS